MPDARRPIDYGMQEHEKTSPPPCAFIFAGSEEGEALFGGGDHRHLRYATQRQHQQPSYDIGGDSRGGLGFAPHSAWESGDEEKVPYKIQEGPRSLSTALHLVFLKLVLMLVVFYPPSSVARLSLWQSGGLGFVALLVASFHSTRSN